MSALSLKVRRARYRCSGGNGWNSHQTYSFAYHPMTGQYKVVHVPSHVESWIWEASSVHVFTLGEASWREVHAGPNARCILGACHLAEVDGMVYWMTGNTGRVAAFDLEDESVTLTEPLPAGTEPKPIDYWLTKVHARLGAVVGGGESATVWVLEGTRWNCWFMVKEQLRWNMTMPHFARGDYVLTHAGSNKFIDRRKTSEAARCWQGGVAQIRRSDHRQGAVVEAVLSLGSGIQQTFVYAETKEPLSV